ncbi:unnamed protein product [Cuscuta europaea]|uniref:BED-type domain-containing protein n=1 Tax=Cuscuta europaea TaxID=41803 RepID=A0A9P0YJR6_CUSEU|nr:unnamed protein product [Cuscuta europaea]
MHGEMTSPRSSGYVDPGWEHGVAQDEKKKKVRCNYCAKVVSGGIYRLKQHLARLSGEVTYCDKAPEEVRFKMRENLEGCRFSKKPRRVEYDEQTYMNFHGSDYAEEEDHIGYKNKGKQLANYNDKGLVINLTPLRSLGYIDPGWEHGVPQDERKKKVKCNYCEKIVSGGINRFKQHIARIPGEVAPCKNAPEEVYLRIKENMKWHRTGRRHRRPHTKELSAFYINNSDNEEDDEDEYEDLEEDTVQNMSNEKYLVGENKRVESDSRRHFRGALPEPLTKRSKFGTYGATPKALIPQTPIGKVKAGSDKKAFKEVMSAICKFFYHAGVPPHAANSPHFHKMLELVGNYGQDFVGPSSQMISGRFLHDEIAAIKNHFTEYKSSWAVTGCSVLVDSWKDTQDRTLINILVSCPRGMYFVCSVDATDVIEDSMHLFKLLDGVVEEMGEENVMQVITQNTPSYQAAGKMLEEKRRHLFWTPCASDCIDRMLEDFLKIKWVGECIEKGQEVTKFIYNRLWLLSLMKKEFTGGQELLRPSFTKFASSFTTVQSLLDHRNCLKKMFQSNKWLSSRCSKSDEGKEIEKIVMNASFWRKMTYVRKSVDPILEVLHNINNNESHTIPFIYNDMYRAKLVIKANHNDDVRKYQLFWDVIDRHWNILSHHSLYLSAYFLNPSYRYRPDFIPHPEVVRGLNACIVKLEADSTRRISASMQISDFNAAKADFGTDLAISTRMELNPAAWWQQHGINCLELQRIAVRILSQTCSSFGCEHNWSIYDRVHDQRHNYLAQKRLNDAIYVHYNLRLRERQRKVSNDPIVLDSVLQESLFYDWIVGSDRQVLQEDEEGLYSEMEPGEYDDNDFMEHDGGGNGMEMATLAGAAGSLEVHHWRTDEDEEDDLNFLDDDISD